MSRTANWKGTMYPVVAENHFYDIIEVPVNTILDRYTQLPANSLQKNVIEKSKNPDMMAIAQSILDQSELPDNIDPDGTIQVQVYKDEHRESGQYNKIKAPFNAEDLSDAAVMATLLQGKDHKFDATLKEAHKRGFNFTSKQIAVAAQKGRTLQQ